MTWALLPHLAAAVGALPIYAPTVTTNDIYFHHPGAQPALKYNHDVDIVRFKGRYFAAWNANAAGAEDVPGQFNYLSVSDDFVHWSAPVRMFTAAGGAENPVDSDNQWQPGFINLRDETLFCAWSDFVARRVFVAQSSDGLRWRNVEVPNAPAALVGRASGFPTNHGLVTSRGTLLFPCSLPFTDRQRANPGSTRYAGVLRSTDGGASWSWSAPVEAVSWTEAGEDPARFGGETITLWEPMVYEQADGRLGLLIRNSTAQEHAERAELPHRMLLAATSADQGQTWTRCKPVEVDTICSRNYAVSGVGSPDSLLMVMNDHNVRVPDRISFDRYFLALYCAPVSDPDLLLPGPVVQPAGGTAFYPNGFVDDGRMYLAYTYPPGIHSTVVAPLPDFSRPFLLPRGGRAGLTLADGLATFAQRQATLGLVLTEALTRAPRLRLAFDVEVQRYGGGDWPIVTLGGKTRGGCVLRVIWSAERAADVFQVSSGGGGWTDVGVCALRTWHHVELELCAQGFTVRIDDQPAQSFARPVLRKVAFGGLYVPPEWPQGVSRASEVRLNLRTILVE